MSTKVITFKGPAPTFKQVRDTNKASQRAALKRAGYAPCRTCGKMTRGVVESVDLQVTTAADAEHDYNSGVTTLQTWRPTGTYGYHGTGICSLRCGFRWANARAPKKQP